MNGQPPSVFPPVFTPLVRIAGDISTLCRELSFTLA